MCGNLYLALQPPPPSERGLRFRFASSFLAEDPRLILCWGDSVEAVSVGDGWIEIEADEAEKHVDVEYARAAEAAAPLLEASKDGRRDEQVLEEELKKLAETLQFTCDLVGKPVPLVNEALCLDERLIKYRVALAEMEEELVLVEKLKEERKLKEEIRLKLAAYKKLEGATRRPLQKLDWIAERNEEEEGSDEDDSQGLQDELARRNVAAKAVDADASRTTSLVFAESSDDTWQPLALPSSAKRALGLREKNVAESGSSWLSDLHVLGFEGVSRRLRCAAKTETVAPQKASAATPLRSKLQPKQLNPKLLKPALLKPKLKQDNSGEQVATCNETVAICNEMEALRNEILAMCKDSDVSMDTDASKVSTPSNGLELPTLLGSRHRSVTSLRDCDTDPSFDDTVHRMQSFKRIKLADDVAPKTTYALQAAAALQNAAEVTHG
jgi:hypothetical protein